MRFLSLACLSLFLASCSSVQMPEPVGLAYLSNKPLRLNVARVEVVKQYQSSSRPPHVENELPVPPTAMIQQWAQDRLLPVGKGGGHAVVTIEEASVIEKSLKGPGGFKKVFTSNPSEEYEAKMSVKIEIFDEFGNAKGFAYARAQGSRTVADNLTLGQR
ncbi:MAG: hypothetical protein U1A05_04465, partial [Alphaproteobacteria bacterium]|nr:hypothetical protein [Alphaproteobacteria bacterium]